ncbi:MAG TPA: Ig-like domain-containing protein, partial [Nitrososphaera sp.]
MICTLKRVKRIPSSPSNCVPRVKDTNSGSKIGKILYGFILVFSLFLANSIFSGYAGQQPLGKVQEASAQLGPIPGLFGNPGSSDFLSLAVAIMPTIQGADLNVSNVAGSTNCDLLVPVTYIDGGCMSSLPLLTPFTVQPNVTQPINETAFVDYNYSQPSTLGVSIGLSSDNITAGETQTVTVTVSDENSTEPISGAYITSNITDSYGTSLNDYTGTTDDTGQTSFDYAIPADALSDYYEVLVTATANGYDNATASTTFEVIGSDYDSLYDNSTSDDFNYDDGNYNYDDGSSSSDDDDNDYDSPTVKSVDPNDGQDNVPLNTEIKVTFDEKMDQDTLDDGSLDIFCETTCDIDNVGVNADPSSKSVTYTLDRQLEPGTRYEAQLDFNIQDDNGNYLDCSNSNDVDSSCTWQFTTTGNGNANIELSPSTGAVGSSVHITGTGFDPNSDILITFDLVRVALDSTNNNGEFDADFDVPISLSGTHTVTATDGSNSDSATFTVTSSPPTNPIITINPAFGPVGTLVNITGINFDPDSAITVTFGGTPVTPTEPAEITTSSSGGFSANFTVPTSTIGSKIVSATDEGSNSDSTLFLVTLVTGTSTSQQLSKSIGNLSSIQNLSNQSDSSDLANTTIQNESNIITSTPNVTAPPSPLDESNQTDTSSPSESTTPSESGENVPDIDINNTETVTTILVPDKEDKNEIAIALEESPKQLPENQSSSSDTRVASESSDNTKVSSDNTKISKKDLEQDRKDRALFEKYLGGDNDESK